MAMYVLKNIVDGEDIEDIEVDSAGLSANGSPISANTLRVLSSYGIHVHETYISKKITEEMFEEADLIIPMTRMIAEDLIERFDEDDKIVSVFDMIGKDVPDPYGKGYYEYEQVWHILQLAVPHIVNIITDPKFGAKKKKKKKNKR